MQYQSHHRRLFRVARIVRRAVGVALIVFGAFALRGLPAHAATQGGVATITSPATAMPLASGGSATVFTVALPTAAACSGDTANKGYHVYSYLEPAGTNITSITFINFPSAGYGFVDSGGTYYGAANTAINTGQIVNIPTNFEWDKLVTSGGGVVPLSTLLNGGT